MRLGTTQLRKRFLRGETIPGMQRTLRRAAAVSNHVLTALLALIRRPWLCEACSYQNAVKISVLVSPCTGNLRTMLKSLVRRCEAVESNMQLQGTSCSHWTYQRGARQALCGPAPIGVRA